MKRILRTSKKLISFNIFKTLREKTKPVPQKPSTSQSSAGVGNRNETNTQPNI